ncbi:MAG: hypothetical protein CVV24_14680 [Ignavibacteriae bacterium HGW-Ignavibacteriae-3]|nr:MAG: hypothetical protein CVV24_14680 [Ignavibacteriae bacterium HGW-Ignavibacteriae-3]
MKSKRYFRVWHYITAIIFLIGIIRFPEILLTFKLFHEFIFLSFSQHGFFVHQFNFEIADQFASVVILFASAVMTLIKREKWKFLNLKCDATVSAAVLLTALAVLTPLISPFNPNLQFDLSVAKNLSPLSVKELIESDFLQSNDENPLTEYFNIKKEILRDVCDQNFYLADSTNIQELKSYQKGRELSLNKTGMEITGVKKIIFPFGTDEYGRDLFSRMIYATRLSILIGLGAVFFTFIIGVSLGFTAGYFSRTMDLVLNRFTEMLLAFPTIFLVILFLASFGNSLINVVFVLGIAGWMSLFKIVRGEIISLKSKNYILTSRNLGMSKTELLRKEFIPLLLPSISVNLVFQFANVIIAESSLSFLGLTGDHFYPSWGTLMQEGQFYLQQAWWITLWPCIFIVVTLLTINSIGKRISQYVSPFIRI